MADLDMAEGDFRVLSLVIYDSRGDKTRILYAYPGDSQHNQAILDDYQKLDQKVGECVGHAFSSYKTPRALTYVQMNGIEVLPGQGWYIAALCVVENLRDENARNRFRDGVQILIESIECPNIRSLLERKPIELDEKWMGEEMARLSRAGS